MADMVLDRVHFLAAALLLFRGRSRAKTGDSVSACCSYHSPSAGERVDLGENDSDDPQTGRGAAKLPLRLY